MEHDKIIEAIEQSGYLFEQEVATIIEDNFFHIRTNSAFIDPDEEKSREIDVWGYKKVYTNNSEKVNIGIKIIAECKNNSSPLVFINRKKNQVDFYYESPNFIFPKPVYTIRVEPKRISEVDGFKYFDIEGIYPYSLSTNKAVQFCRINHNGKKLKAEHGSIYDSLFFPIVKCLEHFKKEDTKYRSLTEWSEFIIYFPMIVVDSEIFCINSAKQPYKLEKVHHVPFIREIDSKTIKGNYLIHFVTKEGLDDFINNHIDSFSEKFKDKIVEKLEL